MADDDALRDEPFSWAMRKDGTVIVSYGSAPVVTLRGTTAARFAARIETADTVAAQQLMARMTGNFKRGNERRGKGTGGRT